MKSFIQSAKECLTLNDTFYSPGIWDGKQSQFAIEYRKDEYLTTVSVETNIYFLLFMAAVNRELE